MPAILARLHLEQRPGATAERRADERALLAAEDRAQPGASRRGSTNHHRGLFPIASAFDAIQRHGPRARHGRHALPRRRSVGFGDRHGAEVARIRRRSPDAAGVGIRDRAWIAIAVIDVADALARKHWTRG